MERLTERWGEGDVWVKNHDYVSAAYRLADYEDTGLTPKDVKRMSNILLDVGIDYNCSWEYVKNWLLDARLRELAEADRAGRLVVLPCTDLARPQPHPRGGGESIGGDEGWLN